MAHPSPLAARHTADDAMMLPYGPPESQIAVPAAFDAVELEYASLRKACVLADAPHRATIEITGDDRTLIFGALLWMADRLEGEKGDHARKVWRDWGRAAFEMEAKEKAGK